MLRCHILFLMDNINLEGYFRINVTLKDLKYRTVSIIESMMKFVHMSVWLKKWTLSQDQRFQILVLFLEKFERQYFIIMILIL